MQWFRLVAVIQHFWNLTGIYLLPVIVVNIGNVAAYLFQMALGRSLNVDDFGSFNALFSAALILTAPANFLPLIVAQAAIALDRNKGQERKLLVWFIRAAGLGALVLMTFGLALIWSFQESFNAGFMTMSAVMVVTLFSCLHPVTVGLLQARGHYASASFVIGGNPLLRFAFGVLLVTWLGTGVAGAMWSVALPIMLTFILGIWLLRDLFGETGLELPEKVKQLLRKATWQQAVSVTAITALFNVDVVVARLLLPGDISGLYSGAAIISRIALLLPSALAGIIFTESARDIRIARTNIITGLAMTALLAGGIGLVFMVAGETIVTLLLGARFGDAGNLLRVMGAAMACLAISQAMIMTLAGRGDYSYLRVLVLCALLPAFIPVVLGLKAMGIATLTLIINAALMLACSWLTFRVLKVPPSEQDI